MESEAYENSKITTEQLVSIVVITFNSSKYVIETLESAKAQTYKNIELIISDDCSTDDTVEICQKWIAENKIRFFRVELITILKNAGIPANCNRGIKAAKGAWVKLMAGDDIMDINCIKLNIQYVSTHSKVKIAISNIVKFQNGTQNYIAGKETYPNLVDLLVGTPNPMVQHKALLNSYFGNSIALFIAKSVFNDVIYDESIPFMEDYPFALNVTKAGYSFNYFNAITAYYRLSEYSVFGSIPNSILFNDFYEKRHQFDLKYRHPFISKTRKKAELFEYHRLKIFDYLGLNKNNFFCRTLNSITLRLNPYRYAIKV